MACEANVDISGRGKRRKVGRCIMGGVWILACRRLPRRGRDCFGSWSLGAFGGRRGWKLGKERQPRSDQGLVVRSPNPGIVGVAISRGKKKRKGAVGCQKE
jgi:hypothetical protein